VKGLNVISQAFIYEEILGEADEVRLKYAYFIRVGPRHADSQGLLIEYYPVIFHVYPRSAIF